MSREIKFRIWDGRKIYYNPYIPNHGKWAMLDETIKDCQDNYIMLEEFTGLHDKNGTGRYEGDIIKRDTGYVFVEDKKYFSLGSKNGAKCYGYDYHENDEVIGNIHENSNLLK